MKRSAPALALLLLFAPGLARADVDDFDHRVAYDDSGIWKRSNQLDLTYAATATVVAGSIFADRDSRMCKNFDRSMDAMVMSLATTTAMKYAFQRQRPDQGNGGGAFFAGSGNHSFPSGEVAQISAVVTPFILEYHHDHPWVYALALLPAYDAVARVKVRQHWQSDVLVGAAIGTGFGIYAHKRDTPFFFHALPDGGGMFGYRKEWR
jgi:undecaprenyl-diphosphatase